MWRKSLRNGKRCVFFLGKRWLCSGVQYFWSIPGEFAAFRKVRACVWQVGRPVCVPQPIVAGKFPDGKWKIAEAERRPPKLTWPTCLRPQFVNVRASPNQLTPAFAIFHRAFPIPTRWPNIVFLHIPRFGFQTFHHHILLSHTFSTISWPILSHN